MLDTDSDADTTVRLTAEKTRANGIAIALFVAVWGALQWMLPAAPAPPS